MADVSLAGVTKRFAENIAVDDLSLDVDNGSFVVLLGPTGAGKTTTLRLVAGLETPDRGQIVIGQRDVTKSPPAARDVAFVFQQYSLYPHLSVYDNLAFPLRSPTRRTEEAEVRRKVTETAALLRIEGKLGNRATNLSGGEMQRVAIGRALVRRPSIYLMDEPLSSLDAKLRAELRLELKRIQVELGATFLYVTHDQIEAMTMATTIGVIEIGAHRANRLSPADIRKPEQSVRGRASRPARDQSDAPTIVAGLARAARGSDDRRPHGASAYRQGAGRGGAWTGYLDRTPGRSEPSAHYDRTARRSYARRSRRGPSRRRRRRRRFGETIVLRPQRCTGRDMTDARNEDGRCGEDEARLREIERRRRLVAAVADSVIAHSDELTALDSAIGDGDHGLNMTRGFEAVLQDIDSLAATELAGNGQSGGHEARHEGGRSLRTAVRHTVSRLGQGMPAEPSRTGATTAFAAAIAAVRRPRQERRRSEDDARRAHSRLWAFADGGDRPPSRMPPQRRRNRQSPMRAIRGRASFLGERSIGHMDPGAKSSSLMIAALCDEWGEA